MDAVSDDNGVSSAVAAGVAAANALAASAGLTNPSASDTGTPGPTSPAVPASLPTPQQHVTLRALISTKEAGVVIGKEGRNVAEMRDSIGVKAGVSKVISGVNDRVLTVSGPLENVSRAFMHIARSFEENLGTNGYAVGAASAAAGDTGSASKDELIAPQRIRLLVPHSLVGSIIGRQGAKIREIQETADVKLNASKELLPQSSERLVEIQGKVDALGTAVLLISQCLVSDMDRAVGTVLYNPMVRLAQTPYAVAGMPPLGLSGPPHGQTGRRLAATATAAGTGTGGSRGRGRVGQGRSSANYSGFDESQLQTQYIPIPGDMVGCIIGRGGSKISEIRRLSGSQINISKEPCNDAGERMFTITGTPEATDKALSLLYQQLEEQRQQHVG